MLPPPSRWWQVSSGCEGLGHGVRAGLGPLLTSPHRRWMGRHQLRVAGCPLPRLGLSRHLVSLRLAFVCASGYHTGRPGRVPAPGVPRWVQVPEGAIYATITLGTACPRAGVPVIRACCLALRRVHAPAWPLRSRPRAWAPHAVCPPSAEPACDIACMAGVPRAAWSFRPLLQDRLQEDRLQERWGQQKWGWN